MLEIREIHKTFEGHPLLRGVSFQVLPGETACLLGASGSGKSTLLRIIAGLETAESGQVLWQGQDLADTPVHQRGFGLMFQDYALFPHRSVAENVAFGLRMQNLPREEIGARVNQALEQMNLLSFANRRVTELSGGEQQRVALARALAPRPRLLMLDEPLGALDRALRERLVEELHRLLHSSGIPAIYVTHDQDEAFALADQLILLHDGLVEQAGTPAQVYAHPATPWAARFLGLSNLIPGQVVTSAPLRVRTRLGDFEPAPDATSQFSPGQGVTLLLHPTGALIVNETPPVNSVQGVVSDALFRGESFHIEVRCADGITLEWTCSQALALGSEVIFAVPPSAVVCLPIVESAHA